MPPRFDVPPGDNPVLGTPGAPVPHLAFLDFQSLHCRRVQPVLQQLLEDYGPLVRLLVRDLPRPFHNRARQAAVAAECSREQGMYWRYHDLLLQNQGSLETPRLERFASTLGRGERSWGCSLWGRAGVGGGSLSALIL